MHPVDKGYTELANGGAAGGFRWRLLVSGDAADLTTLLALTAADGSQVGGGGMAGPALYDGESINLSVHRSDQGPTYVVARADPRIRRLRLSLATGDEVTVLPVAESDALGLTFFACILPAPLLAATGVDAEGRAFDGYRPPAWPGLA